MYLKFWEIFAKLSSIEVMAMISPSNTIFIGDQTLIFPNLWTEKQRHLCSFLCILSWVKLGLSFLCLEAICNSVWTLNTLFTLGLWLIGLKKISSKLALLKWQELQSPFTLLLFIVFSRHDFFWWSAVLFFFLGMILYVIEINDPSLLYNFSYPFRKDFPMTAGTCIFLNEMSI